MQPFFFLSLMIIVAKNDDSGCGDISFSLCLFPVRFTEGVWLDDDGTYICEAKNRFGSIQTEARISVTGLGMLSFLCPFVAHFRDNGLIILVFF